MLPILPPLPQNKRDVAKAAQAAADDAGLVLPDVAVMALQQGRVIEAIKLIRTANPGLDLARAKGALDRMQVTRTPPMRDSATPTQTQQANARASAIAAANRPPTVAAGDTPGGMRWVVVAVVIAVAAWLLLSR